MRVLAAWLLIPALLALGGCVPSAQKATAPETVVTLRTTQGDIVLRFFPEIAPEHAANFIAHGRSGYYTGCTFHRVIPGFVIQGGDPNTKDDDPANDGHGGYGYKGEGTTLPAEFSDRPHVRGILSMARSSDPNSGGSQFFICHGDAPSLDGKYSVFGEVVGGIDAVDRIVNVERDESDRPFEDQIIEDVIVEDWPVAKIEANKAAMWAADGTFSSP